MVLRLLMAGVFLTSLPYLASQTKPTHTPIVELPQGDVTRIGSPNGKWSLVFECPNDCAQEKLWLEESTSHSRRLVKEYGRSLGISWSPDARLFFVNDDSGSTDARCYVYEPTTLRETDVAKVIRAADASSAKFLDSGHSYLRARRWLNSHQMLLILEGYNDGLPPGGFSLLYRVDLNGGIRKLSQHTQK